MVRKVLCTIVLISLYLLISCCSREEAPLPLIRIGHAPHDHHSPLYIAAMNPDYFRENGDLYLKEITPRKKYQLISNGKPQAEILLHTSTGGKELIRKLSEDQLDLAFGGIAANLYFIDQGSPIKILAPVMAEGAGLVINNNIPANNWQEFIDYVRQQKNPVRIGYKIAFSQNLIFEHAINHEGLTYNKQLAESGAMISMINLFGAKNLIPALENGLVDGFVVNQPFPALAEYKQVGRTIVNLDEMPPENYWQNHPCCVLSSKSKFYQKQPKLALQLATLFLRANRFIVNNPDQAIAQVAEWLQLPVEVEQKSIPSIKFVIDYDEGWNRGTSFLIKALVESKKLTGKVKKAYEDKTALELIYNLDLLENARQRM
jgi:NitT/TauT family transport system substrate-binding protein